MKKRFTRIISVFLPVIITTSLLSACNENLGFGSYRFNKAHIFYGTGGTCVEIDSWKDNEIGVELKLKYNKGSIYCSEGTYILVENYCPICKR